jgi:hypothetical protein
MVGKAGTAFARQLTPELSTYANRRVFQEAVSVKGFARPVRVYRVIGIYDELEKDGRIIREERDGFRLLVDLTKGNQASTIAVVESVLARLRGNRHF